MTRIALAIALILVPFAAIAQEVVKPPVEECPDKECSVPYQVCLVRSDHKSRGFERAMCDKFADDAGYVHGVLRPCGVGGDLKCILCKEPAVAYQCDGVGPDPGPTK